jgi:hypothetical protein
MVDYSPPEVCWIINCIEHLGALLFFILPCYYYFYVYRHEHHMITKTCILLLIPDAMQIINFLPIHLLDLHNGYLDDGRYCKASAYLIVASIFASNGANITVAYVTKRMLDPKDQKVTIRLIAIAGVVSWTLGLGLASYFLGQGYLGSHRGVYCCTSEIARGDIAGPVFICYGVCIGGMGYLYWQAYKQVKFSVLPQRDGAQELSDSPATHSTDEGGTVNKVEKEPNRVPQTSVADSSGGVSELRSLQMHVNSGDVAISPLASPTSPSRRKAKRVSNAASVIAKRGVVMILTYYVCWSIIVLNAIFELAGWESRSIWWDIAGAIAAKTQPSIDAFLMLTSMHKVHELKMAQKQRSGAEAAFSPRSQPLSALSSPVHGLKQRVNRSKPTSPVSKLVVVKEKETLVENRPQ